MFAFPPGQSGVVLGIEFDSTNLTWRLPTHKWTSIIILLQQFFNLPFIPLNFFQKLHGKLNDFSQKAILLRGFTYHQNKFLQQFATTGSTTLPKPNLLCNELIFWTNYILHHSVPAPIPLIIPNPPYIALHFFSDAAGPARISTLLTGNHIDTTSLDSGAASVGFVDHPLQTKFLQPFFATTLTWPLPLLSIPQLNSTLLEFIALLFPFLGLKTKLTGHQIILHVDNKACVDVWNSRTCKNDEMLAIFLQTLHVIEAALECRLFIVHSPRRSTPVTCLVDNLSRLSTTTSSDNQAIRHAHQYHLRGPLLDWLFQPSIDWNLPKKIVQYVTSIHE